MGILQVQYSKTQQDDLMGLFQGVEWQMMISGCIDADKNKAFERIDGLVARYRTMVAKQTGLQIGAIGALVDYKGLHVHLLLVGQNRFGNTLRDLDADKVRELQRMWFGLLGGTCRYSSIFNLEGVKRYVIGENLVNKWSTVLTPVGISLLRKIKRVNRRKNAGQNSTCY